jgi:Fe2+ or Zn2+ uptake regulation protein
MGPPFFTKSGFVPPFEKTNSKWFDHLISEREHDHAFCQKAEHLRMYSMVMILLLDAGADGASELPRNDDDD